MVGWEKGQTNSNLDFWWESEGGVPKKLNLEALKSSGKDLFYPPTHKNGFKTCNWEL
jgi:hypothetical protein